MTVTSDSAPLSTAVFNAAFTHEASGYIRGVGLIFQMCVGQLFTELRMKPLNTISFIESDRFPIK